MNGGEGAVNGGEGAAYQSYERLREVYGPATAAEREAQGSTGAHPSPRKPAVSRPRSPEGKTPNKTEQQRSRTDGAGGGQNLFSGSSTD